MWPDHWPTTRTMRYPSDPAALRKGSPEWRRCMVQEVGLPEAWLDFAASGANVPFELADRQGTTIESRHHTRIRVLIARVLLGSHTFAPYSHAEISSEVV